jgi:hypothetical protein
MKQVKSAKNLNPTADYLSGAQALNYFPDGDRYFSLGASQLSSIEDRSNGEALRAHCSLYWALASKE